MSVLSLSYFSLYHFSVYLFSIFLLVKILIYYVSHYFDLVLLFSFFHSLDNSLYNYDKPFHPLYNLQILDHLRYSSFGSFFHHVLFLPYLLRFDIGYIVFLYLIIFLNLFFCLDIPHLIFLLLLLIHLFSNY